MRVNGTKRDRPATPVGPGDVLTLALAGQVRVVRITTLAIRRGPATEARGLYEDLTPAPDPGTSGGGPRPTKKDRRDLDLLRGTE